MVDFNKLQDVSSKASVQHFDKLITSIFIDGPTEKLSAGVSALVDGKGPGEGASTQVASVETGAGPSMLDQIKNLGANLSFATWSNKSAEPTVEQTPILQTASLEQPVVAPPQAEGVVHMNDGHTGQLASQSFDGQKINRGGLGILSA